ncbi:hypothetical protein RIF29_27171 [Crotalaria pallida]|uniref:Uncharacterized protein n=1 Tax=Crotalaria pallida TaxID=3830 RepID=A0AAN9I082_CROPI
MPHFMSQNPVAISGPLADDSSCFLLDDEAYPSSFHCPTLTFSLHDEVYSVISSVQSLPRFVDLSAGIRRTLDEVVARLVNSITNAS